MLYPLTQYTKGLQLCQIFLSMAMLTQQNMKLPEPVNETFGIWGFQEESFMIQWFPASLSLQCKVYLCVQSNSSQYIFKASFNAYLTSSRIELTTLLYKWEQHKSHPLCCLLFWYIFQDSASSSPDKAMTNILIIKQNNSL